MSEEDFRKGLPTKEQIEAHYKQGKPYGYWQSQTGSLFTLFRLGWSADGLVGDCRPWNKNDELTELPECFRSGAWQPADSSNRLLPWSVVEAGCEYRTPTDDEIRAHEANGGAWSGGKGHFRLLGFRDDVLHCWIVHNLEAHPSDYSSLPAGSWPISERPDFRDKIRPVDRQGKPVSWSGLRTSTPLVVAAQAPPVPTPAASTGFIHITLPAEKKTMQIDISKLSTEDRAQLRRQLDAAEPPTFNSALRSGLEHAPIELALDRAHALLDRAVDTLWAAGSEDDKATVRRFFRDALKSEYGKAGMAFGAGALLPHAADAAGALLPSESNAPRYLNRAAWLFTERGATIVAREIGSTAIDSIGPLIGTLRMLLADLVNGMRTAEAGIAGLLPAASRPLNFDAVPKPETVEK